jgi:hypothetical protein
MAAFAEKKRSQPYAAGRPSGCEDTLRIGE